MAETQKLAGLLAGIGFSGLEADVYLALLREPGATGYRVAQLTGKPAPNTYKALDSLKAKGAVVQDESTGARNYRPLPIGDYLEGRRRQLDTQRVAIEEELKDVAVPPPEGGIFKLRQVDQVYSRARQMIAAAKRMLLVDAFPGPLEELRPDIEKAIKRGVHVFIKAYRPVEFKGSDLVAPETGDDGQLGIWNGDWLNVVADGCEIVLAFMTHEGSGVNEAVWSHNAYLNLLLTNGMLHEFFFTRLLQLLRKDMTRAEIAPEMNRLGNVYLDRGAWCEMVPDGWINEWPEKKKAPGSSRRARKPARRQDGRK